MTIRSPWTLALFAALSLAPARDAAAQPAKPNAGDTARPLDEAKRLHAEAVKLKADGKLAEAIATLERVLAIIQKSPGPKSIEAANVTEDLAELTMAVDVRRAAPLYVRCIGILEGKLGKDHLALSRPLHNLSLAYQHMGETEKAIEAAGRALAIREKALGSANDLTLGSIANLASIYAKSKQYKKAITLSERIVKELERALGPGHSVVADQIEDLARLHYGDGDLAGAVALLDRALAIREKNKGPENPELLEFIDTVASLHAQNREIDRALELAARALAIREKTRGPDHPDVAGSLTLVAKLYYEKGDGKRSIVLTGRALRIVEQARGAQHIEVATVLNTLAIYVIDQAGYDLAIELLERAYAIQRRMFGHAHESVAATLNNLAEAHLRRGDLKRAEPYQERALGIFEALLGSDHKDVAVALNNLASTQIERGDYASGIPRLKRALAIYEARLGPNHTDVAIAAGNLGEVYLRMGDIGQAEPLLKRAIAIREAAHGPEHPLVANPLHNLASALQKKGEAARAEEIFKRVIAIYEKAFGPDHPAVATTLINLALLRANRGELDQSEATSRRAIDIQERALGKTHPILAIAHKNLAMLYVEKGDYARAVEEQTRAEEINERHLGLLIATGSEAQKLAYMATLSLATNTTIALHLRASGSRGAANDGGSARTNRASPPYPPNEAAARLAMTTILRRKGRVLDAVTDSLGALRARLAPEDRALLANLAAARSKLARELLSPPKADGSGWTAISKHQNEVARIEAAVSAKSAEFRVVTEVVTLEKVQAALPEDTTLIEIVAYQNELPGSSSASMGGPPGQAESQPLHEPRYAAYLLRRRGPPEAVDLGPVARIDAQVSAFRAALSDPDRRDVVSLGRALDELVMRPVRGLLKGSRSIAISPDGALNLVPFGALTDEDGRYLVERASFTYLTSGRDLLRQGIRAASRQGATIIADPRFDMKTAPTAESGTRGEEGGTARGSADLGRFATAKFTPLPGTAEEANALRSVLPTPKVLTGSAATKASLQGLHGPGILHIATHGFFLDEKTAGGSSGRGLELEAAPLTSSGRPPDGGATSPQAWQSLESPLIRSGLALAGANGAKADGVLTALEAAGLDLYGTELVVLSACETGVGSATTGDGVYGLRRALVIAGAQTQVMSLWKVDDAATRDLMIAYYGELQGGGGRGSSMHKVQLAMLGQKETSHPYFWGAFIVSGDPGRVSSFAGRSSVPPPRGPRGCACEVAGAAPLTASSAPATGARRSVFLLALAAVASLARRSKARRGAVEGKPR
jgi:CHAT domain-containing protein/tetratricopeptide (TPR) repeat protein